jgi:NADH-quinone oxidoreductase subunit N
MSVDWPAILPFLFLAGGGTAAYLWGALRPRSSTLPFAAALVAVLLCLIAALAAGSAGREFAGLMELSAFSRFYTVLLAAISGLALLLLHQYAGPREFANEVLYGTMLFAALGMIGLAGSSHWLSFFLSLELLSLALYILIAVRRGHGQSYEAALKYFIMGAVASAFLIFGIGLLYAATGTLNIGRSMAALKAAGDMYLPVAAMALIMVGIGFKISLVPFHLWTPDVYEGAPAPVTAFLATGSKVALFAVLLRLTRSLSPLPAPLLLVFWALAAATMLVGNITALVQQRVKRLLAYSSVAHMGYLFMALLAGGEAGGTAVLFYSAVYGLMDLAAFGALGLMSEGEEDLNDLEEFQGLGYQRPWAAGLFALSLIALAGLPPTAGFFGKFLIFTAAFKAGFLALGLLGVFSAVLSIYFYQKVVVALYLREKRTTLSWTGFGWAGLVAGVILLVLILWLGLLPATLLGIIRPIIL